MTTEQLLKQISEEIKQTEYSIKRISQMLDYKIDRIEIRSNQFKIGTQPYATEIKDREFDEDLRAEITETVYQCLRDDLELKQQRLIKLNDPLEIAMRIKKSQE